MRNYYSSLNLDVNAEERDIRVAIDALEDEELIQDEDLETIMLDADKRTHYKRVHLQYEAIAAALAHYEVKKLHDTHQWSKRVVEFEVDDEHDFLD